jgi:hypothetical protein
MRKGLKDPLAVVRAANLLDEQIAAMGLNVEISSDFEEFAAIRLAARDSIVSPMFDPTINSLTDQNSFWMIARNNDGDPVAFQAFRLDTVDGSLAEWATRWMAGLYLLRSELVVPSHLVAPANSITHSITGPNVYQGELWVSRFFRNRTCSAIFPRLGMMLCLLKWQPVSMWGVMGKAMASRGHPTRAGFPHTESSFLRWKMPPSGAESNEYIILAKKTDLEFIAGQTTAIPP